MIGWFESSDACRDARKSSSARAIGRNAGLGVFSGGTNRSRLIEGEGRGGGGIGIGKEDGEEGNGISDG